MGAPLPPGVIIFCSFHPVERDKAPLFAHQIDVSPLLDQLHKGHTVIVNFSRVRVRIRTCRKIDGGYPCRVTFLHHPVGHDLQFACIIAWSCGRRAHLADDRRAHQIKNATVMLGLLQHLDERTDLITQFDDGHFVHCQP